MKSITTAEQFNEIINKDDKALIKFQAGWCPDCKRMDMFIDPIVEQYNQYTWYEVNRDELPEIAEKYEVNQKDNKFYFFHPFSVTVF